LTPPVAARDNSCNIPLDRNPARKWGGVIMQCAVRSMIAFSMLLHIVAPASAQCCGVAPAFRDWFDSSSTVASRKASEFMML
jgi:hypothetical protein